VGDGVVVSAHDGGGARGNNSVSLFCFGVRRGREEGMKEGASGGRRGDLEAHVT
jgi:hypothetical protein